MGTQGSGKGRKDERGLWSVIHRLVIRRDRHSRDAPGKDLSRREESLCNCLKGPLIEVCVFIRFQQISLALSLKFWGNCTEGDKGEGGRREREGSERDKRKRNRHLKQKEKEQRGKQRKSNGEVRHCILKGFEVCVCAPLCVRACVRSLVCV